MSQFQGAQSKDIFDLTQKIIVLTGGLGLLGRQFAAEFLQRNARVVILDKNIQSASSIPHLIDANPDQILLCETDVTQAKSLQSALARVQDRWGCPNVLINNAALDSPPNAPATENGPFESYPEASWDKVMEVNLKGVFLSSQIIGGAMAKNNSGSIINISSIYGLVSPDQRIYEYRAKDGDPFVKPVAYSVSKSGILNFSRYLATYWAKNNVRVNTLTLAGVLNGQDQRFLKNYCDRIPIGRMANPSEYNGALVFLASDASVYMTGSNLVIDGGWTAW